MKKKKLTVILVALTMLIGGGTVEVSANSGQAHTHILCGASECAGHVGIDKHTTDITWTAVSNESELNNMATGGSYYLANDIDINSTLTIANKTVNLCLNGKTLRYVGTAKAPVISLDGGSNLTVSDCKYTETNPNNGGKITGGTDRGIEIYPKAVAADATLNLYGGNVSNNTSTVTGGGIGIQRGHGKTGKLYMYGGSVTGNSTTANGGGIGAIGSAYLYGGTITGNTATYMGGGAVLFSNNGVGGSIRINNNTCENGSDNLYVASPFGDKIYLEVKKLSTNAEIYMSASECPRIVTKNGNDEDNAAKYIERFKSDIEDVYIKTSGYELMMEKKQNVIFDPNGGEGSMDSVKVPRENYELPKCGFTAPEGKIFKGWATSADGTVIDDETYTFTGDGYDSTFYAIWEEAAVASFAAYDADDYELLKEADWDLDDEGWAQIKYPEVEFSVLDEDGNVLGTGTLSEENYSYAEVGGLKKGEPLTIKVTKVPEGYKIPDDITFTITEDGEYEGEGVELDPEDAIVIVLHKDMSTGEENPADATDTGDGMMPFVWFMIMMAAAGTAVVTGKIKLQKLI